MSAIKSVDGIVFFLKGGRAPAFMALKESSFPAAPTLISPSATDDRRLRVEAVIGGGGPAPTFKTAAFAPDMPILGSTLGAAYPGAAHVTLPANTKLVNIRHSCNQTIQFSFDGGVSTHLTLEARHGSNVYDLAANLLSTAADVRVRHAGVAVTAGSVYITSVS